MDPIKALLRATLSMLLLTGCGEAGMSGPHVELASSGGMDGAGSLAGGIDWRSGIFVQRLWVHGSLQYVVFNTRSTPIELNCPGGMPGGPDRSIPGYSMRTLDASMVTYGDISRENRVYCRLADGTSVGNLPPTGFPVFDDRAVINNEGLNGGLIAGIFALHEPQLETDFVEVPGRAFTVTLALHPGSSTVELRHHSSSISVRIDDGIFGYDFAIGALDVVAARSKTATIRTNEDGFIIAGTPNRDDDFLTKVDVDVVVPDDFVGPFILFKANFCRGATDVADFPGARACGLDADGSPVRAFPVDPARL